MIKTKRVYEIPSPEDGIRFLVDRIWPRGIKKEGLQMESWLKDVAPSNELRRWFGHDPSKWEEFRRRYSAELERIPEAWGSILEAARQGDITLLYSAKDEEHNQAVALKSFLEEHI